MQYLKGLGDDLKSGYSTYVLQHDSENISFFAYTGDTAVCSNERALELNAYNRGYFLRKGFSEAICKADPNVIVPVYKDNENKDVFPKSVEEAVRGIYDGELNVSGFRFVEGASETQKEEAFGQLINSFVSTSKNLDFSSEKNLFVVQGNCRQVVYNNGGSEKMKISGVDVQEKLGLNTKAVALNRIYREKFAQKR